MCKPNLQIKKRRKRELHIKKLKSRVPREEEKRVQYAKKIQEWLKTKKEETEEGEIWDMEEKWKICMETMNTTAVEVSKWTTISNKKKLT